MTEAKHQRLRVLRLHRGGGGGGNGQQSPDPRQASTRGTGCESGLRQYSFGASDSSDDEARTLPVTVSLPGDKKEGVLSFRLLTTDEPPRALLTLGGDPDEDYSGPCLEIELTPSALGDATAYIASVEVDCESNEFFRDAPVNGRGTWLVRLAADLMRSLGLRDIHLVDASTVECPGGKPNTQYPLWLHRLLLEPHKMPSWYSSVGFCPAHSAALDAASRVIREYPALSAPRRAGALRGGRPSLGGDKKDAAARARAHADRSPDPSAPGGSRPSSSACWARSRRRSRSVRTRCGGSNAPITRRFCSGWWRSTPRSRRRWARRSRRGSRRWRTCTSIQPVAVHRQATPKTPRPRSDLGSVRRDDLTCVLHQEQGRQTSSTEQC